MDVISLAKINELKKNGGVGYTEKTKVTLLPEGTLGTTDMNGTYLVMLSTPLDINDGDILTVVWNGKQYVCKPFLLAAEGRTDFVFGNLGMAGMGDDTGEPFCYAGGMFLVAESGTYTVSVTAETETIHTIDPKFLPSGGQSLYVDITPYFSATGIGDSLVGNGSCTAEEAKALFDRLVGDSVVGIQRRFESGGDFGVQQFAFSLKEFVKSQGVYALYGTFFFENILHSLYLNINGDSVMFTIEELNL